MKSLHTLILLVFCTTLGYGQFQIQGKVLNDADEALPFSSVVVLAKGDSSIISFGMTNEEGLFKIDIEQPGEYITQYSYVGYSSFYQTINSNWEQKVISIPTVKLKKSTTVLKEVEVSAERIPMGIKGDTIVYDAKAFKTREGANVEDLLKQLPGIQIGKDGSIKAQGEDVNKVLVDGKEFFGNDPKIATKNLEAEAIDKVEVFDKKSEIAEFTGIDDGQEEKAINLQLKEDYKKGAFGRLTAALGSQSTFLGKLNYNRFNTKSRLSIIGNTNNINEQAFSLQDYMDFLGGLGNISNVNGGILSATQNSNQGINTAHSVGTNLNHSFHEKLSLNANYFYLRNDRDLRQQIFSSNFSPENQFNSQQSTSNNQLNQDHRLNSKLKWKISPLTAISLHNSIKTNGLSIKDQSSTLFSSNNNFSETNGLSNRNDDNVFWNARLLLKRKFLKKGRSWISSINYEKAVIEQENNIDNIIFEQMLHQFQRFNTEVNKQSFSSSYTEPIVKKWYASINYSYNNDRHTPKRNFFDIAGEQEVLNQELSGEFSREVSKHRPSISIKRNSKRLTLTTAVASEQIQLNTNDISNSFHYVLPSAFAKWKIKNAKNLTASYQTTINVPSLSQLITIPNNINPNRNYIGNKNLVPEYRQSLSLRFNFFDNFNFSNIFLTLMAEKTDNKIVEQTNVNDDLTIDVTPTNSDLHESISGFASISQPIKPLGVVLNLNGNTSWSRYNSWLNGVPTQVAEENYSGRFAIEKRKKEKWDYRVGLNLSWTFRRYAIDVNFNQDFANYNWFADLDWKPQEDLIVSIGYTFTRYNDVFFSSAQELHLINATVRKSFMEDKWALEFTANDILNQTIGLNRTGNDNSLREERFNVRSQYFMLGVSRKIGKKRKKSS